MGPDERLKAVLTLIHEIAKLEKANPPPQDEIARLKAKLQFLLAKDSEGATKP